MMNGEEKANHEKLLKDLSAENLSDEEIVAMWKVPAIHQIHDGLSDFKTQHFLVSKGVSKEYALTAAKELRIEASQQSQTNEKAGSFFTQLMQNLLSWFKY